LFVVKANLLKTRRKYAGIWNGINAGRDGHKILVNRRVFKRRAITGLEGFKSYGHMKLTRFYEGLIRLLSLLLIIGGVILFLLSLVSPYGLHHPRH